MLKKLYIFRIVIFILVVVYCKFNFSASKTITLNKCNFKTISGTVPERLGKIIYKLKQPLASRNLSNNVLLLHGPTGNGKTAMVNEMATEIGAEIISIKTQTIVDKYQGNGAEFINTIFDENNKKALVSPKPIILFFDEVDIMARPDSKDNYQDWKAAKQLFWQWLDDIKPNKNIFVAMATNVKTLDARVVTRCGRNCIEVSNPNDSMREEIIRFHFKRLNIQADEALIKNLMQKTNKLSARSITNIIDYVNEDAMDFYNDKITVQMFEDPITQELKTPQTIEDNKQEQDQEFTNSVQNGSAIINTTLNLLRGGYEAYCIFTGKDTPKKGGKKGKGSKGLQTLLIMLMKTLWIFIMIK